MTTVVPLSVGRWLCARGWHRKGAPVYRERWPFPVGYVCRRCVTLVPDEHPNDHGGW